MELKEYQEAALEAFSRWREALATGPGAVACRRRSVAAGRAGYSYPRRPPQLS